MLNYWSWLLSSTFKSNDPLSSTYQGHSCKLTRVTLKIHPPSNFEFGFEKTQVRISYIQCKLVKFLINVSTHPKCRSKVKTLCPCVTVCTYSTTVLQPSNMPFLTSRKGHPYSRSDRRGCAIYECLKKGPNWTFLNFCPWGLVHFWRLFNIDCQYWHSEVMMQNHDGVGGVAIVPEPDLFFTLITDWWLPMPLPMPDTYIRLATLRRNLMSSPK